MVSGVSVPVAKAAKARILFNAGWHFSWLGEGAAISVKLASFSHSEWDTSEINNAAWIQNCFEKGYYISGGYGGRVVAWKQIDDSFPRVVRENLLKYQKLIRR